MRTVLMVAGGILVFAARDTLSGTPINQVNEENEEQNAEYGDDDNPAGAQTTTGAFAVSASTGTSTAATTTTTFFLCQRIANQSNQ